MEVVCYVSRVGVSLMPIAYIVYAHLTAFCWRARALRGGAASDHSEQDAAGAARICPSFAAAFVRAYERAGIPMPRQAAARSPTAYAPCALLSRGRFLPPEPCRERLPPRQAAE